MGGTDTTESPLDAVAELAGADVAAAFELLSNETRLAILLALWEAKDPETAIVDSDETTVSFSALRERVGLRDSGQFNYHLDKLVGRFVRQTDQGYSLTEPAEQILSAVLAGTLADHASFADEPIDAECYRCGGATVIDYDDGHLIVRCTACAGTFQQPDERPGVIVKVYRPPAGLVDRSPQAFHRHGNTWDRHRQYSMLEGACPDCSGAVSTTTHICREHDATEDAVCEACGSAFEVLTLFVCDVCKLAWQTPAWSPIFTEMAVRAFFFERGLDHDALYDTFDTKPLVDAIDKVVVVGEDPLELAVHVELDGDRLVVTLDENASVVDVTERPTWGDR